MQFLNPMSERLIEDFKRLERPEAISWSVLITRSFIICSHKLNAAQSAAPLVRLLGCRLASD